MSAAAETYLDLDDGPLDADDGAPAGPSITLRRSEAEQWLDILFGVRPGYVAVAYGLGPYRTAKNEYRHRKWREVRYPWPAQRNTLLTDVAGLLADADSDGPLVDVYVCPHLRSSDHRRAETGVRHAGNARPPVALHADLDGPPADPQLWAELDPLLVASGSNGHEHGFIMLDIPLDDLPRWYQLQRALRDRLGGGADAKIADNDVLRLPGTVNCKPTSLRAGEPPSDPTPVSLLGWGGRVWTVSELAALLGVDLPRPAPPLRTARAGNNTAPATVPVPAVLAANVQAAADGFADAPDKSAQWARLIGCALAAGYSRDEAFAIAVTHGLPHILRYTGREVAEFERCWTKSLTWQEATDAELDRLVTDCTSFTTPGKLGARTARMRADAGQPGALVAHARHMIFDVIEGHYPGARAVRAIAQVYRDAGGRNPDAPRQIVAVALGSILRTAATG